MRGDYDANRLALSGEVRRGARSILDATLSYPVALTLFSAKATGDSLRGRIRADSVDLALVEALSPKVRNSRGRLALDLALSGEPGHPHVGGRVTVAGGDIEVPDMGIRLASMDGLITVDAARDSLNIDRLTWTSPASGGSGSLNGTVGFRRLTQAVLRLRFDHPRKPAVGKLGVGPLG